MNRFSRPLFLFIRFILPLVGMVQYALAQQPSDCNYVPGAGHFDLCVSIVPPNTSGARMVLDTTGFFKNEAGTGKVIVEAEFGDIGSSGGEFETDNPGWVVPAGDMEGGEFLWFRARGSLRFWDAAQQQWLDAPPNGERVRYIGSLRPDLAIVLIPTPEQAEAIAFYEAGTIWSADGLSGPLEAPIEPAASVAAVGANGDAIHAHLDFCVEDSDGDCSMNNYGNPATGVYLIEFQLFSTAVSGLQQKYFDSPPILVALNRGLDRDAYNLAIDALTVLDIAIDDSAPLPAAGILIMTGP